MNLMRETQMDSKKMFNNYKCRFCNYSNEDLPLLKNHYRKHHPVHKETVDGATGYYQANKLVAMECSNHQFCCFTNCPNNQTSVIKKNINKIAIKLEPDGHYPQLDGFFDKEQYAEPNKPIFVCVELLEQSAEYTPDHLSKWVKLFGIMRSFSVKDVVQKKNKNLLFTKRVPPIKIQHDTVQMIKLVAEKEKLLLEKKNSENLSLLTQVINVGLLGQVTQKQLEKVKVDHEKDEQITQLLSYVNSMGYFAGFDASNKLVVSDTAQMPCHKKPKIDLENDLVEVKLFVKQKNLQVVNNFLANLKK